MSGECEQCGEHAGDCKCSRRKGEWVEIELGRSNRKIFLQILLEPFEIWIDTQGLPQSAFLCAMCDAQPMMQVQCGKRGNHTRYFLNIDWAINDWGGPKDFVQALKTRKQMMIDDREQLIKKYSNKIT